MKHLDDFLGRLGGVVECGQGWKALCPAHPDERPSLSISLGEGNRIILYCHAGCYQDEVLKALKLSWGDLFAQGPDQGAPPPVTASRRPGDLGEEERDFRSAMYHNLLGNLPLEEGHLAHLLGRGLSQLQIDAAGYSSLVAPDYRKAATDLYALYGERLFTVPGFRRVRWSGGPDRATLTLKAGLVIPVRDREGFIQALQIRTGEPGRKYQWLSGGDGRSCGCPCHVPLAVPMAGVGLLRITEGPLKADVATALDPSTPTIGVAGVSTWKEALPVVRACRPGTVRVAFDSDWHTKPAVEKAMYALCEALDREGFAVETECWPDKYKGIDDLLLAGGTTATRTVVVPERFRQGPEADARGGAVITCAADVEELPVEWLWQGWLPRGALVILDGDPGLGKSLLTTDLVARLSTGRALAGDVARPPVRALMLTSEDDYGRTVKPRLRQAGADLHRVFFWEGVRRSGRDLLALPEFPTDLDTLKEKVQEYAAGLVVVDPLYGHLDMKIDSHKDQHVRLVLAELTRLAQATQAAILVVRHLNKKEGSSAIYRGSGSIGVIGQARAGWIMLNDPDEPDDMHRLLGQTKNNLARKPDVQRIFVIDQPQIHLAWDGADERKIDQVLNGGGAAAAVGARQAAAQFLLWKLQEGAQAPARVFEDARKLGISQRTVERAAKELRVRAVKAVGEKGLTFWHAPADSKALTPGVAGAEFVDEGGAGGPPQSFRAAAETAGASGEAAAAGPAGAPDGPVA